MSIASCSRVTRCARSAARHSGIWRRQSPKTVDERIPSTRKFLYRVTPAGIDRNPGPASIGMVARHRRNPHPIDRCRRIEITNALQQAVRVFVLHLEARAGNGRRTERIDQQLISPGNIATAEDVAGEQFWRTASDYRTFALPIAAIPSSNGRSAARDCTLRVKKRKFATSCRVRVSRSVDSPVYRGRTTTATRSLPWYRSGVSSRTVSASLATSVTVPENGPSPHSVPNSHGSLT